MGGRDSRSTTLRLLLLAGLVVASQSASLTRIQSAEFGPLPQSAVCPQTCTLVNKQIQYTPGSTYLYKVQLSTRIGDQSQNQAPTSSEDDQTPSFENQEVVITAQAEISAYSQCELVMRLRKVQVAGFEDGRSQRLASQLQAAPIHFAYEDGIVADVCADQADDQWIIDVKKSVISALQMSSSDVAQPQTLIETDISGRCETVYEPLESNSEVTILRKTKSRSKCSDRHQVNIAFFPAAYGFNQALQNSLSSVLTPNSTSECTQVLKGQIIESVACEDRQELRYPLNGLPITSRIELQLTEKRAEIAVQRIETPFVRKHRTTSSSPFTSTASSKVNSIFSSTVAESQRRAYSIGEVAHLLKNICRKVHYSVEYDVPVLFHELITALHFLPAADQAQLWSQIHAGSICPSPKLRDIFLDAAALSGSEGSIEVLLQAYQSQHVISRARANYLFGLLAFSKAPTVAAARRLVTFIQHQQQQQNQKLVQLPRGVLFGATGFVHNLQMTAEGQSTQAHQLVQDLVHSLIQAIKVVIPQAMASQPEHQQALTLIYSLKNLVLVDQVFQPTAHQLVELLKQIVSSSSPAPHTIEISVAIVRTLVNAGIDDSVRQYLLQSILINPQDRHHVELQIEAYRAIVLSGATQSQLETIKQWTERISSSSSRRNGPQQQLVNYIRSHQANLRSTSDPHKQTILPAGAPVFEAPSGAWFGVSRNYEFSYVDHEIGVGASLEGDVIYEASTAQSAQQLFPVPQTVAFNYTMPIGGQELQLVEVRFHQHGLEPLIERHMRAMDRQFRSADPAKVALETLKYLLIHGTEIFAENPHIRVLLQIVVDGKTVVLADERDITSEDIAIAELDFLGQLTEQLHSSIAIDRAFAITPVDSLVRFPSVNGLPVTVRLNSSVVFGFKSEVAVDVRNADDTRISFAVYPSVAVTAETAVAFHAGSEKKVVEHVQSWSSAPQLNFEARGSRGRIVTFKVDLPQKKYTLARIESVIYSRNVATGERVRLMVPKSSSNQIVGSYPTSDIHICSKATEKALGVAICYDLSYNTNLPYGRGFDLLAEITVVKTDSGLTSYEATFESPLKFSQIFSQKSQLRSAKDIIDELAPFRFNFNTPGSEVDRHIQLELELVNSHSALVKEARLRLKTPWKAVTGALVLRNEAKERVAKVELTVDGQPKWLAAEVALEVVRRGAKTEWKPRVILSMNSILERPVHLAGALSISRGRKTSIHLQLEDSIARRQYIKGTYIRERPSERNALARTSADLVVALQGLQAKSAATYEHGDRLVKIEISSDYKLPSWDRTEQAKVALKLQNHSNNSGEKKVTKMTGIGLIKATQLSKYEINYSQNLHIISGESLEHDLKLDWASDSDSSSSSSSSPQVRLHQTAKKTGQRGKVDLEASSLVIYRPQQVHYEVKVTGGAVVSPLLSYHLAAVGTGKHSSQFNFKGDVAYALLSKSPLKLDMSISLKAPQVGLVYVYHDEIEEKLPGEYHGHLLLQMSPVDQYDMTYVYRLSEDESQRAMEHRMDVIFLKGSMKKLAYKHHGLLRLEDGGKAISLRSRLTDEQAAKGANEIWNTQIDLAPGKKEITFSSLPKEIRAKAKYEAVYQGPSSAQWSFDSPALTHQAEYEYSGPEGQYWSFDSKTKRAGEKLMEIQSKANAKLGHRRLRLSSKYFDGECELELPSESQQKKAKLRFDLPNSWSHESTFSQSPEQSIMQVDSRTHYAQNSVPIYDLSARYDPSTSQSQFKLNTPLNSVEMQAEMSQAKKIALKKALLKFKRGSDYEHQSQFTFEPSTSAVDFDSLTTGKSGSPLTKLKYAYAGHRDQLHQIDLQTPEEISVIGGQWSGQWDGQRRSAKIDWANKRANLKHSTQITADQPDQIMVSFDSTTSDYQSGRPLFQAKGALNLSDRSWISLKSHKKDQLRKMDFEAHRSKRSAKLDFDYDQYTHQSEINAGDEQEQDQQWKAKCNTRKSGKTIFDLDARIGGIKGANKFDASIPNYDFSSMLDLPSQIASMDLKSRRSGRHLLGSVGVNQQADADRSFHFDFAWDIDRDPASKVALDLLIKRVPIESRSRSAGQQLMIEASAAYAESKLIFNSQFVPKSGGFSSPHPIRLSLSFIPSSSSSSSNSQRDSWQLIYLHQMEQPNSFTCKWEWIVGGRPQYGLQLNGKLENESFGNSAKKIIFSAKTSAPASKPRLALTFNLVAGVRAPGNAYFFDSSLVHGNDQTSQKKYQATFDLTKHLETRKVDGKLEIRLPALKVHVAAFSLDLTERRFSLELINEQSGKMVDIEASYGHHLVHLKVASQGAQSLLVPKVDALVRYVPGEELHARLSLDEERKFELTAKYSGELSKLQFYVLTKVDSVYTPSVEFIAEGRKPSEESGSAQRSVAITGKWNMVEVVKAGFNQAAVRQWTAQGFVASVGSGDKLVEASVVSTPTEEHFTTYQVKVQPKEGNAYGMKAFGAKIEERRPTAANEYIRSVKVDIYQQEQEQQEKRIQILSTEVSLKHAKWAQIPEMVEVSLRHVPSASHGSLRVAIREKVSAEDSDSQNSLFSTVPETASVSGQKRSSVLRDQMLLGWNTKSVGFALITSEWTSPSQATEHALKIYTPSGRVVEHRCAHLWSEQLVFFKQALKADYQKAESQSQEQPLYQTTVIVQRNHQNQEAGQGYKGKLLVESFKFARSPKAVHFEVQPASQERPIEAKLRIDIGASEKEALTMKVIVENKPAAVSAGNRYFGLASVLNQTVHFEAKSEKSVDFSVDGHVSQSSVGMLWKNVNRKGKLQQGHYLLQFIGDDRFEAVLSNPTTQYLINGIYKRKQIQNQESPLVMDLTVQKSVSKHSNSYSSSAKSNQLVSEHKVHIESAGRCIRAEIEDVQKLTSSRQINLCADLQRANILNLAVDSIGANGQKTAEFSARLDAKSAAKSLALGASWNPVYSRRLLQTLLNIKEASGSESDLVNQISHHELVQELSAKYDSLFRSVLANAAQPLAEVAKELAPIAAEYGITEAVLQRWASTLWTPVANSFSSISQTAQENLDQLTSAYEETVEEVKKACARSSGCRSISEALAKSNDEIARLASKSMVNLLKKTHRFVVRSKGALLEKMNAQQWAEQLTDLVPETVSETLKSSIESAYSWTRSTVLNPSGPFSGVIRHLETIFGELMGSGDQSSIKWQRIESSISEAVHLLASPSAWASSVRVLLWDPTNGQLMVEVKSPQTAFTSAFGGLDSSDNSNSSASYSWLNGINSYDRAAQPTKAASSRFY